MSATQEAGTETEKKGGPSIAVKVMIGIVIGILVGFLLLNVSPVGVQPGDVLEATIDGEEVQLTVEDARPEAAVTVSGESGEIRGMFPEPLRIIGASEADAGDLLSQASGRDVAITKVAERGRVVVRPAITEAIYIVGEIFLRLLRMLVVPLIVATVLVGIASLGDIRKLGKIGKQTATWYFGTMLVAVTFALIYTNLFKPGVGLADSPGFGASAVEGNVAVAEQTVADLILKTIPTNPFAAIAQMDVVGILFFVIVVAIAMLKLGKKKVAPVFNFFEGLNDIVYAIVGWVMKLAPIGIGCLIANTIGTQNVGYIQPLITSLGLFFATMLCTLGTHFAFLITLMWLTTKISPWHFLKTMSPALANAFGTASSSATLPLTMQCVDKLGVSKRIRGFTLPVGATLNMDGTALFEATAVLFFAQAFAQDFGLGQQILVALISVVAAIGAAGIPSAGLVTMVLVLSAVGLPATQMSILWAVDRPLDMLRTMVNVTGDSSVTAMVQSFNPEIKQSEDDLFSEYEEIEPEASRGS